MKMSHMRAMHLSPQEWLRECSIVASQQLTSRPARLANLELLALAAAAASAVTAPLRPS